MQLSWYSLLSSYLPPYISLLTWEIIRSTQITNKGVISLTYIELLQINDKDNSPVEKRAKGMNRQVTEEELQMTLVYVKGPSSLIVIRQIHAKGMVFFPMAKMGAYLYLCLYLYLFIYICADVCCW